jgi:hypothetical protein
MLSAHVGGVPVEEILLPTMTTGAAASLLVAKGWILGRVRCRRGQDR